MAEEMVLRVPVVAALGVLAGMGGLSGRVGQGGAPDVATAFASLAKE